MHNLWSYDRDYAYVCFFLFFVFQLINYQFQGLFGFMCLNYETNWCPQWGHGMEKTLRTGATWTSVWYRDHTSAGLLMSTPLCKSNGTFFSDMDINELTSVLHKYKTPVTKCCILTCCWVNLVCIKHLIVKIMPEKHVWGPDFLMSDSLYIFQLFEN